MIKHIIVFKMKDKANTQMVADNLAALKNKIEDLEVFEVGINFSPRANAFDFSLYSEFRDEAHLAHYIQHPEHKKVVELIEKYGSERYVVDYRV